MDLSNWQKTVFADLEVSDGEQTQAYRLTFATCSNFDIALYMHRRTKIWGTMTLRFGKAWTSNDEAIALLNVQLAHLIILAGLKRVEIKEGDTWIETKLPDAWYDPERFPHEVPAGVIDTLTDAVFEAGNPRRIFSILRDDAEEKKMLKLTVSPSAQLPAPLPKLKKKQRVKTRA